AVARMFVFMTLMYHGRFCAPGEALGGPWSAARRPGQRARGLRLEWAWRGRRSSHRAVVERAVTGIHFARQRAGSETHRRRKKNQVSAIPLLTSPKRATVKATPARSAQTVIARPTTMVAGR